MASKKERKLLRTKKANPCDCHLKCSKKILATISLTLIWFFPLVCNATQEHCIQIPALKRTARLGDLYDEKTDTLFFEVGVFSRAIPDKFITEIQNPTIKKFTKITDSFIDQFNLFSIDKNTGVNILTGITKPKGALSIFQGKTPSASQLTGTLLYELKTVVQHLHSFQEELKDTYNKAIMAHKDATHVVTQISWGSQVAVQLQMKPDSISQNDTRTSRNLLKSELRSLRGPLTDSDELPSNFVINVTSDIPVSNKNPTTAQQVKKILSEVPRLVGDLNGGKGVPLSYSLTPISQIREHLGVIRQNTKAYKLNEFTLNELIEVFQNLNSAEVQLDQLNDRIKTNPNCSTQETANKLLDLQSMFRNFKSNFTTTVKKSLTQVRSGLEGNSILFDLIDRFSESDFEPGNISLQVQAFDRDVEKIELCTDFEKTFSNIRYFGAGTAEKGGLINTLTKIQNFSQNPIFILFTKFEFIHEEPVKYTNTFSQFLTKLEEGSSSTAVYVNCDFPSDFCDSINETSLFQYHNRSISAFQINSSDFAVTTCSKESCLNGGICLKKGQKTSCECAAGFIGEKCEDIECVLPGTCNSALAKLPSCKCRPGYVKDVRDPAKCQSSNSDNATLIFGDDAGIQQLSISQRNTTRLLSDTSLGSALDFHYPSKTMFWSGQIRPSNTINSAPISSGASKTLVFTDTGAGILSIAIDWVHHHLYYTDVNKEKISVANLDGSMKKVLVNDGLSTPSSIVVNPSTGWMYWVDYWLKKIERAGMDGSRRQTIATTTDYPSGLAIDYTENRLYWTTYYHPCSIHSINTDGSDQKLVLRAAAPTFTGCDFRSIAIFEDYMYWRDRSTDKMYRANKCNGAELTEWGSDTGNRREVRVYHFSKQPAVANACAGRTLQCSHLCLPIPGIGNATLSSICACPDGRSLSSDGHNCS